MLPFTTYSIPESPKNGIPSTGKWLCMVVNQTLSEADLDLLHKISTALKADFEKDVYCIEQTDTNKNSLIAEALSDKKLIISFGVTPSQFGLWIDLQKPGMRILETCTIIRTVAISALAGNAVAKKELWSDMQAYTASKNG